MLTAPNRPLEVADLELDPPRRDEVLVRLAATGICRSDLSYVDGKWPVPLPVVLGHEGAGTIEAVGEGVDPARIGERVVLTFSPACGACRFCLEGRANLCLDAAAGLDTGFLRDGSTRLSRDGVRVHHLAYVSSFASHAVVPANGALPIDPALDLELACLLGCGVTTGVMSVTRRAGVRPGDAVAIFACGGVGLSAVIGAGLVSAHPIVAVDPVAEKRALALRLGATHAIDPADGDPVEQIRAIVPGGVDVAVRGARPSGDRRPGVPQRALRRDDRPDRAAADGRQGRLRRVRRHAVRAHRARLQHGRRGACAAHPRARPARGRRASSRSSRWSRTGSRSTRSTRRSR